MKKRLLILGMIFTMAVSSAGCGSSSSDNAGKTDQTKQTADVQDSQKDESSDSKSDDDKKDTKYKSADEITMDDLMSHDETPAEDFELIDNSDEIVIEKYVGKDPIVVIPDEIDGKKVVGFNKTFANDKDVVAVRIGNNVTEVAKTAFGNCEKLKYVVLGNSVKTIGGAAFVNTNLQNLILNEGLEKIGEDDFSNMIYPPMNNEGMDLKVPESVTEMHVIDFNLIVKAGSYAEQYAKENNLTYTVE
ncbi:leucine-rich repeat domain-containing protein [Roseburia sp. AF02-12]|uniref:leucine-rich repeat domain-containing protein n=1 Tax=Roseburia sp. AF02-12 TaxID=2293126 RepID=UPI000E543857|nr:leucine-rich repeat domain-containing protein [Roseburia sp. AF02-12]RGH30412.1 leucine-rich repeat domain-containing protein [Roseburia sp. AF02-12]